ncbi:hypothetical protein [Oceanobacillus sp. CAU 1775]
MLKRASRRFKFLSISTKGNRVLFHFPIKIRESVFNNYWSKINISIPVDPKDKNQIDIELREINSLESVKELINLAYDKRE